MSDLEDAMLFQMRATGLPEPEREVRGIRGRRFAFDFAWRDRMLALEVEGGSYARGRHVRPLGFEADCTKYSLAAIAGWRVVRVTSAMVHDGRALHLIEQALSTEAA